MIKTVKLGEVQTKIIDEVKKTDELKVLLRFGWGGELTGKIAFNPSEDLKVGDEVKVVIERVYEEPEPEEEKEKVAGEVTEAPEAEGEEEAAAEEVSEPLKEEGVEEAPTDELAKPLKVEDKREAPASEVPEAASEVDSGGEDTSEKI